MDTQKLIQLQNPKGISLIVMFGILSLTSLQSMALGSENGARKGPTPDQEGTGPIIIEGEVTRVQGEFSGKDFFQMKDQRYIVETPMGSQWDLHLGEHTQKTGDIFLGDQVKASIGKDGLLQTVQKIEQEKTNPPKNAVVRRQITGMVEKRKGNFLYVKHGDHTEILHLDDQSTFKGDIREGTNIVAQLGDAGYAIRVEVSK